MFRHLATFFLIIVLLLLLGSGWFWFRKSFPQEQESTRVETSAPFKENSPILQEESDILSQFGVADTSDWKTYRNRSIGIELKIPQDWDYLDVFENEDVVCFGKKGELHVVVAGEGEIAGCVVMIRPELEKDMTTLSDVYDKIIPHLRELQNTFTVRNIEFESQKGVLLTYASGSMELYFSHRNDLYKINLQSVEYSAHDSKAADYYRDIYISTLSTIHFFD